ncbi:MAG: phosphotriesterase [Firmicutes bacterium]|nr:phosphotriesterase [Bacillota bacterium]
MSEKMIMTTQGLIAPIELGFTSMHEHISFRGDVLARRLRKNIPPNQLPIHEDDKVCLENVGLLLKNSIMAWDALRQDDEDVMVGEVSDFLNCGGQAILEVSVPGIQLDTAMIGRVALRTGLHVIVSTGFYTWDSWPQEFWNLPISAYYDHMLKEIEQGVQGTSHKAGSIKIAVEDLNQQEQNTLRAAAWLCKETNLPLTIHPCSKPGGGRMQIIGILRQEGVDLSRVVMAHTSVIDYPASFRELIYNPELFKVNIETALQMLDSGVNICFEFCNPLGFEMMGSYRRGDFGQMAGLWQLIDRGFASQIVLGNDVCGRTMLRRGGALGYLRLMTFTIPTLQNAGGVPDAIIRRMTVENPARILAY